MCHPNLNTHIGTLPAAFGCLRIIGFHESMRRSAVYDDARLKTSHMHTKSTAGCACANAHEITIKARTALSSYGNTLPCASNPGTSTFLTRLCALPFGAVVTYSFASQLGFTEHRPEHHAALMRCGASARLF